MLAGNGSKKFRCLDKDGAPLEGAFRFSFGFRLNKADQIEVTWLGPSNESLFRVSMARSGLAVFVDDKQIGSGELKEFDEGSFGYHGLQIESQPGYWRVAVDDAFVHEIPKPEISGVERAVQVNVEGEGSAHFEQVRFIRYKESDN